MLASARTAAIELAELEADLQKKIRAEHAYHAGQQQALTDGLSRTRVTNYNVLLSGHAEALAAKQAPLAAADLRGFLHKKDTGFLDAWGAMESERKAKVEAIEKQMAANRRGLELKRAKIGDLLQRLRTLSEAPTKKQMSRFMMGFVDATLQQIDKGGEAPAKKP